MPGTVADLFTYAGSDPVSQGLYNLIGPCTNSMTCHTTILQLFMNALKLSSLRYRREPVPASWPPGIPNYDTLDILLNLLPEELKEPQSQVMYEQWNCASNAGIGNNAWYIQTYTGSAASLQTFVNGVRAVDYANAYNNLITEYTAKGWGGVIPAPIANPDPKNPPDNVNTKINLLITSINQNDPQLKTLAALKTQVDAPTILNLVFGVAPAANITTVDFCLALVAQIQSTGTAVTANKSHAKTQFFTAVQASLNTNPVWAKNDALKKLKDQLLEKTPAEINKSAALVSKTFANIQLLFQTVLNNPEIAGGRAEIMGIFTSFNAATISQANYLLIQLQTTCTSLSETNNPDPGMLEVWCKKLNEAIPATIHYSDIEALMKVACDVIQAIPLTFNGNPVQLFAFSNFDDIKARPNACGFSKGSSELNSDYLYIYPDAIEYTSSPHSAAPVPITIPYRPVYAIFTDSQTDTFLKFFNVGVNIPAGTFYFTDATNSTLVQTEDFSNPGTVLTFDFDNSTINGLSSVPAAGITGVTEDGTPVTIAGVIDYRIVNVRSVSNVNFFKAIKLLSKWKDLSGQRHYDVLYQTTYPSTLSTITYNTHLIWHVASGNLNRTDSVDDSLCLWEWKAKPGNQETYQMLPKLLGLPLSRQILNRSFSSATIGGKSCSVLPFDMEIYWESDYSGPYITVDSERYVITNTPNPNIPAEIDAALKRAQTSAPASNGAGGDCIRDLFNFTYYRKIAAFANEEKVIKWLPASNRPSDEDGIDLGNVGQPANKTAIGINPPISFTETSNLLQFKKDTGGGPTSTSLKNKGNALYRAGGKRLAAGTVMAKLQNSISIRPLPGTKSSLPATDLAYFVLANSPDFVLPEWQKLKETKRSALPTNQEWCHLLGHGDGGDERLGNFVSGSYHCNTEQLAMESKERRSITQKAPKGTYELRSTAYLFNDNQALLTKNYLDADGTYQKMVKVYSALHVKNKAKPMKQTGAGTVAPFAAFLRYKMYGYTKSAGAAGSKVENKLFDHIFEGQSEFMDQHQFNILKHAAWFAVAGKTKFDEWYKEQSEAAMAGALSMD